MASVMQEIIFGLAGGLGLFLLGFALMGIGFQNVAGDKIYQFMEETKNPLVAMGTGFLMTLTLQETGAATVLLMGLLGSRLIHLKQGICVMLGINLGATLLVHLTSFQIGSYAYLAVGLGFLLYAFGKKHHIQYLGFTALGFGLVFIGLNTMTAAMKPVLENLPLQATLTSIRISPFFGYLLGFFSTALVQNNIATIGLLQALLRQVALGGEESLFLFLPEILPFLLGTCLGVGVIASMAALRGNMLTKRAVWAHWLILGTTTMGLLLFRAPLAQAASWATLQLWGLLEAGKNLVFSSFPASMVPTGARLLTKEVAMTHTLANLLMVLIWLPLSGPLAQFLSERITWFWRQQEEESRDRQYLNEKFYPTPGLALRGAAKEIMRTAQIAIDMLYFARIAFFKGQSSAIKDIAKKEDIVDERRRQITLYLSTLLSKSLLTAPQSRYLAGLIQVINDVERIADHAEHIGEYAQAKVEEKLPFSQVAMDEIGLLYDKVLDICKKALIALEEDDPVLARQVLEREMVIDKLQEEMRQNHINRLNQGRCWPGSGIIYLDLLANLERVADHAANMAEVTLVGKEELI
ncbi:Na/Pi cotransporter family protein [Capillibacterium thermochitinicola]|uniref:Na/Pi cotransporter family protein n=1 Tax=Capillibacterium thermochitinicola TaxID=2699427 RepID=A0A8J6HQV1_9FIRM|nr:Na/Pi cotransporter family protein [Capillibacterium thermochitinicola]MBA2132381.1 Na/Pi cotransporter family protein [Capillibacterium thermochitinicola]